MKLLISLILVILSLFIAFLKSTELKKNLNDSKILLELSEKIKSNFCSEMLPLYRLSEDFFNKYHEKNLSFSSLDELKRYIGNEFSALPYVSEYVEILSKIPALSSNELSEYCSRLNIIAEKGYKDSCESYKKNGKNAYILFPGIISIFILILL